jgi:hypothetical protein
MPGANRQTVWFTDPEGYTAARPSSSNIDDRRE